MMQREGVQKEEEEKILKRKFRAKGGGTSVVRSSLKKSRK